MTAQTIRAESSYSFFSGWDSLLATDLRGTLAVSRKKEDSFEIREIHTLAVVSELYLTRLPVRRGFDRDHKPACARIICVLHKFNDGQFVASYELSSDQSLQIRGSF